MQKSNLNKPPAILMISAFGRDEVMKQAERVGIDSFLMKPVNHSLLFNTIMESLGKIPKGILPGRHTKMDAKTWMQPIRGASILLVEDNKINQLVATELLETAGLRVTIANNGLEAIEIFRETIDTTHAVLMDIRMPEMDGFEATGELRKMEKQYGKNASSRRIPIIAMTAHAMVEERNKCLAADMNDHIAKPIDPKILYETLLKWIHPNEVTQEILPRKLAAESAPSNLPQGLSGIDVEKALTRLEGNRALYRKMIVTFASSYKETAVLLEEALVRDDLNLIQRTAHTFKGSAGNIGADFLWAKAIELENSVISGTIREQPEILHTFCDTLRDILDSIDRWLRAEQSVLPSSRSIDANSPDREFLFSRLKELDLLLENGHYESLAELKKIKSLLREGEWVEEIDRLEKTIENYDFDEAQTLLSELTRTIFPRSNT